MRQTTMVAFLFLTITLPARAQFRDRVNLNKLERSLAGCVVDFTHNHGADRRLFSPILGRPRDLYVYLPPGYTPSKAYPMLVYLHMSAVDEHTFVGSDRINELDEMIQTGQFPPTVVVMPDGMIDGENRLSGPHSMFVNGRFGRFEDHLLQEVLPFVMTRYSVRPEPEAHAILGVSAGGVGAMSIALRHPDVIGAVATLSAPLNLLYTTCNNDPLEDFSPATFRWKASYDPDEVIGKFYHGLDRVKARRYVEPVFGDDPNLVGARIAAVNPASLLATIPLEPGHPAVYVNYGKKDGYNFDAQAENFLWIARQRNFPVDSEQDPIGNHNLAYFRRNHVLAFRWIARHLLPPVDR